MPPGTIRICLNFPGFKDPENVISAPKSCPRAGHDQEKEANYSDSKEADFLEDKRGRGGEFRRRSSRPGYFRNKMSNAARANFRLLELIFRDRF